MRRPKREKVKAVDANAVIDRLRKAVAVETDTELAAYLNVGTSTVSNWRKRNSIPIERLVPVLIEVGQTLEYLLFGTRSPRLEDRPVLDDDLVESVFKLLARYGFAVFPTRPTGDDPVKAAVLEYRFLERRTRTLMLELMDDRSMSYDDAKALILSQPSGDDE